jgi:recombination associated protein RdgC
VAVVRRDRKPSISHIQRQLGIGFNRALALMDRMEREGVVKPYVPPDPPQAA